MLAELRAGASSGCAALLKSRLDKTTHFEAGNMRASCVATLALQAFIAYPHSHGPFVSIPDRIAPPAA
jgi:hypothetical protein